MQTLICTSPGHFNWGTSMRPVMKKDHAIIAIKRIGICGTDLHAYQGTQPYFTYPRILGHELSGTLIEFDNAPGFNVGEAVTFIPYFNCGHCIACRSGKPNCCVSIQVFGVHIDGGMCEYVQVPSYALVHGESLTYDELALVEPLAIGAHGIRRAGVEKDDFVLVIGAGPIGIGAMEFARIAGGKVIAMDVSDDRLAFCSRRVGIEHVINPLHGDAMEWLSTYTNGDMASVVIDATGNLKAINAGINYLAHGGRYVLIGLQKEAFSFSHPEFHKRESTLMSSRNATRQDFEHVVAAMKKGWVDPTAYITHRTPFDHVIRDFESWLQPETQVIKAMVSIDH
ncbi:zinc-binding alcohol dehydrogenase family protein [Paraflavitalea soli]|uniref:Zinc-binding alcohol dehydrogenase family protein n=2 Tax=Paraflavitalea soli TaxID=2315862 RepID=A0A3B7MYD0_9BACT|nr:zinc-binding alcohol dehydrogenase family protein [Paraflavitalea soli]